MLQELPFLVPGALVRARGGRWRVADVTRYADCAACQLSGSGGWNAGRRWTLLAPFDRLLPVAGPGPPARCGRRRWMHAFRAWLTAPVRAGSLRTAAAARFDLLAYQLEPALAVLRGETRLLLADEVGLGKTVQAALILAELLARDASAHCLVLSPAGLCEQWVGELTSRFGLPAALADAATLRQLASTAPPGSLVWDRLALPVASLDYVKRPEVLCALTSLRWDALVVDEAHVAALAPERSAAVRAIARRSSHVVLLTATPHAADEEGFRALCEIGRFEGDPPLVSFRRTRDSLGVARTRRAKVLRVRLSRAERRMHRALEQYTARVWRNAAHEESRAARLAMIVLRKRAASGPATLESSLGRRVALLSGSGDVEYGRQLALPLDEDQAACDDADSEPDAVLGAPGLSDRAAELRVLGRLVDLARAAARADTKARLLTRFLERAREPALIFTEYRDTLERLAQKLRISTTLALLHGGMTAAERREAVAAFTGGRTSALLATDAAAHGLNLQRKCRLVIDIELPWTPARLEQRIGRVDRIGQQRAVHAVHLVARATSEERVLARIVARIGRERAALGHADNPLGTLGEDEVARVVFGESAAPGDRSPCRAPVREIDLRSEAAEECRRIAGVRRLLTGGVVAGGDGVPRRPPLDGGRGALCDGRKARRPAATTIGGVEGRWLVLGRRRRALRSLPPGLLCLFSALIVDRNDALVERWNFALRLDLAAPVPRRRLVADMPALLARWQGALAESAANVAATHLDELAAIRRPRDQSRAAREVAIGAAAAASAGALVQPGLFDRRAQRQAEENGKRIEEEREETAARLSRLSTAGDLRLASDPELVLVLGLAD